MIGFGLVIVCLLVAMTVHEFMHAYAGFRLGDTTAHDEGRLSLNPLRHIDPVMTILLPAVAWFAFGFLILAAKPVPFNPRNVRYGEYGAALIAFAGPLSNLVLAGVSAVVMRGLGGEGLLPGLLLLFVQLNVALFVFNLIPIPPLDGSRVLYAFAPEPLQNLLERLEPYGFLIIIALVLLGGFGGLISHLNTNILQLLM